MMNSEVKLEPQSIVTSAAPPVAPTISSSEPKPDAAFTIATASTSPSPSTPPPLPPGSLQKAPSSPTTVIAPNEAPTKSSSSPMPCPSPVTLKAERIETTQTSSDSPSNLQDDDPTREADEDEDDDNIKVTIEDYDFKAIQKQAQPAKQTALLVLETNQEPIDISTLDDKPWRKPGADINDYFNYGFDESTWRIYCDKQSQMRQIVNDINEPQETFKIPVVHAAPIAQQNVMPYLDERMAHAMDTRNAPLAQTVAMQLHHQPHHQHHNPQHHQHQLSAGSGRLKVEDDIKKYERRHDRSSERRHGSKSRERRHSKSRERDREKDKEKDKERKRSRSRDRRSKETRSRPRSRSRDDERRSKRHKSSRHA